MNCLLYAYVSVLKYLYKFLNIIDKKEWPKEYTGEWYSVMYIFEQNNLIESGVSIRVPWLTDRGNLAFEDIKELL